MLTALLAATVMVWIPETVDLTPTDDVWVYPHASEPEKDPYLRAWGAGGQSIAGKDDEDGTFSYSYLKWDLSALPKGARIVEAKLVLNLIANPEFEESYAKEHPLEVRPIKPDFTEKTAVYDKLLAIAPAAGTKSILGVGYPAGFKKDGKEIAVTIDLLKGPADFRKALSESMAASTPQLALAITSSMDPGEAGRTSVYKWFSKDAEKKQLRPVLHLVIDKG